MLKSYRYARKTVSWLYDGDEIWILLKGYYIDRGSYWMKKKPERHSFKKLAAFAKKPEMKYLEDLKNSYEKSIKGQPKNKSSERVIAAYDSSTRFKITKNQHERQRIKTEADEFINTKTPFQKFIMVKRER